MGGFQTRRPPRQHFGGEGEGGDGGPPNKQPSSGFNRMFGGQVMLKHLFFPNKYTNVVAYVAKASSKGNEFTMFEEFHSFAK